MKNEDVIFLFCGSLFLKRKRDKIYYNKMKRKADTLENVRFLEWQRDLYKYYSIADIYVHPAETEAFGRVLIEAIYYKVPVVGRPDAGMKEVIENGNVGIFFNHSVDALKKAIEYILKHYPDDKELTRRRMKIFDLYSIDNYMGKLKSIYEKLLK